MQDSFVSLKELNKTIHTIDGMKRKMEQDKDDFAPRVDKLIKEKTSEWDKEVLNMMERYQDTHRYMTQLVTMDLGHEVSN